MRELKQVEIDKIHSTLLEETVCGRLKWRRTVSLRAGGGRTLRAFAAVFRGRHLVVREVEVENDLSRIQLVLTDDSGADLMDLYWTPCLLRLMNEVIDQAYDISGFLASFGLEQC